MSVEISIQTARRYVLGRQGLWPGRRWHGLDGTEQAMRAIEHLQLDPLVVIARAHDLILHSRVVDYRQDDWATLTYGRRKFFDWGGWLAELVASEGLTPMRTVGNSLKRTVPPAELAAWRERKIAGGQLIEVRVEGWNVPQVALAEDLLVLDRLAAGGRPSAWDPLDATTDDEATPLAPLDPVSARGRAKPLFDFDYVWEVYKPAHLRKWGYYTMPILWGDRLVARFDSRLDRATGTLIINGLWLEDEGLARDDAFAEALRRGMSRFADFLEARVVDASAVRQSRLRKRLAITKRLPAKATRPRRTPDGFAPTARNEEGRSPS